MTGPRLILPLGYPNFKDFKNSNLRWKMANKNEQPAPATSSSEGTYHIFLFFSFWYDYLLCVGLRPWLVMRK
ncbi:hypothetical protein C5167_046489 [Papaver somniferum]|uniref:Uncharacterized protein n=1 Tax=Papaver somniferum TaxID=3469 RepID=A0A4Y7LHF0_PAPSO|nr:hypothetical protein C5167_046489 [Papaver somniferum]